MFQLKSFLLSFLTYLLIASISFADGDEKKDRHEFKILTQVETTPVDSQDKTGTCWSFAGTSFLETELIRMGKGVHDLSEMFFVRHTYPVKANIYRRYHGMSNFGQGGQAHDVMNAVRDFGIVPKEFYNAKIVDAKKYNHSELSELLKSNLNIAIKRKSGKLTQQSAELFEKTLDIYLGELPEKFEYNGIEYTPVSFRENMGIDPDDYIEFTSFTHHPFYEAINLEIPDNFTNDLYYNIPINDLMNLIDDAINNGYSIYWDGDAGSDNFYRKECYGVIPADDGDEKSITDEGEEELLPEIEKVVTQEMRQESFDDHSITDDHLMHITGIAENQDGTKFYYTKNSWGVKDRKYDGYWYLSEQYIRLKTVALMVHKDAIPLELKEKIGL